MKLEQLRHIIAIEKYKSISQAAKELYTRQPALSTSLTNLEKEIGVQIFQRTPRGVLPTEDGVKILETIHRIMNDVDILLEYANQNDPNNLTGKIKVSVSPIFSYLYFDIVTRYKERFPNVDFQLSVHPFIRMKALFRQGEYNVAIDYVPHKILKEENWAYHTLKSHTLELFVGPSSRFYDKQEVSLAELQNEQFLAFSEEYWSGINRTLHIQKEPLFIEDNASILQILRKSDVIGAMVDAHDKLDAENYEGRPRIIRINDLPEEKISFNGHLIYPGNRQLTLLEQQTIQFLKELMLEIE